MDRPSDRSAEPEAHAPPRPLRRFLRAFASADSYGLVLLLIVVTYLLSVSVVTKWSPSVVLVIQVVTVWFTLRTARARRSTRLLADIVLAAALVIAILGGIAGTETLRTASVLFASGFLYFIAPFSIVRHLILRRAIDEQTMLGAIAAYLLFGLFFAFVYRFFAVAQTGPFFGSNGDGTLSQAIFFSFTTMTTTGYGNLVPAENPGQSVAVLEMIVGQLFLIAAVGKIVAEWRPRRRLGGEADQPTD
jgi:hypothetical protein